MATSKDKGGQPVDSGSRDSERIRMLLEDDRLSEARALLEETLPGNPQNRELVELEEVLRPPRVRPRPITDADRTEEFQWILANRDAYRGRWVAVQGDVLVADAASFAELHQRIKKLEKPPLVHRVQ